ncbi:MAG: prephenate dehydrogenase [Clostridia bacterium]|nr:prephenate dehydrogenase [Clostridia bacterium]
MHITVIGLGLIGGSLIKGLKNKSHDLYGYDINAEVMKQVYEEGLILNSTFDNRILESTDILFLCLPPKACISFLKKIQTNLKPKCIITDVAGIKSELMLQIHGFLREDLHFVGGHPMAGREGQGFSRSSESIFLGANYLLVNMNAPKEAIDTLKTIIIDLGCRHIEEIDPEVHDAIIAYTSHMPHLISSLLVLCNKYEQTPYCIAGSYKDITRVTDLNVPLWSNLFFDNREYLIRAIEDFELELSQMKEHLIQGNFNKIESTLVEVTEKRNLIFPQERFG